jgi:hypothetical protein
MSSWFYAPNVLTNAKIGEWAYIDACKMHGRGDQLPDGAEIIAGSVMVQPRPVDAEDDWPVGHVLVLWSARVADPRMRKIV